MISCKALWPVTSTSLISEFRWFLYAIASLSAISHLWDVFWWVKMHLKFQGLYLFCFWTKLHEQRTTNTSHNLVSCSGLGCLGPSALEWLANALIIGEIQIQTQSQFVPLFFLPSFPLISSLPLSRLTFFQLPVTKYCSKRRAQGFTFGWSFLSPSVEWACGCLVHRLLYKQMANYLWAATKVNSKYVNWERIKYSSTIRHLLWKLSVTRCIKDSPSVCSCGISL